jgi:hypothetical protein
MAYGKGDFPLEQASKIGHLKLTNHPTITALISSFETTTKAPESVLPAKSGTIDVSASTQLSRIVTIDGGQAVVPNEYRREKRLAFIQVAACMLKISDLRYMREHPMMDPRDWKKMTEENWYHPAVLPLCGVRLPWRTVKETIRELIDAALTELQLYETLKFLVYREWDTAYTIPEDEKPAMDCWSCGERFPLPRHAVSMQCPQCNHEHRLSDYLRIGADSPDTWSREESANNLRDVLETLTLFHFLRVYSGKPALGSTLFIKDGPLLLRAHLSRLVEPIRSFIEFIRGRGWPLYLVGVEKTGDFVDYVEEFKQQIPDPGDFFLPDVRFLVEEINGATMSPNYRNRVSYGAKVALRAGPDHVIALSVPTGGFKLSPTSADLLGFEESVRALSELLSYRYPNAIIPLVLANSTVSIARKPSGGILKAFADQLMIANTVSRT